MLESMTKYSVGENLKKPTLWRNVFAFIFLTERQNGITITEENLVTIDVFTF